VGEAECPGLAIGGRIGGEGLTGGSGAGCSGSVSGLLGGVGAASTGGDAFTASRGSGSRRSGSSAVAGGSSRSAS